MPRVPGSVPAHRAELLDEFCACLAATGRRYVLYREAARRVPSAGPISARGRAVRCLTGLAVMCTSGRS